MKDAYDSCVPFSIRLQIWHMSHEWPRSFVAPFMDPFLYLAVCGIFLLERLAPAREDQRILSVGLMQDVLYFALHNFFTLGMVAVILGWLRTAYEGNLSSLTIHGVEQWPVGMKAITAILFSDFLDWLHHLIRHKVWYFWQFHAVHHSQVHMNMFTDDRRHPMDDVIANVLICIPMFMLTIDTSLAMSLVLILKWYPKVYHANVRTNFGILRYVLVSPQHHRVHHSSAPQHQDTNFGVIFSIWDRLFGTVYRDSSEYPQTGIVDQQFPLERDLKGFGLLRTYLRQFTYPFRVIARSVR